MNTARRVGRYTKNETAELLKMFEEGYSVYKICRNLNRSQKSIRNNLIRLGLIEGEITPKRSNKKDVLLLYQSPRSIVLDNVSFALKLLILFVVFVIFPQANILETLLFEIFY